MAWVCLGFFSRASIGTGMNALLALFSSDFGSVCIDEDHWEGARVGGDKFIASNNLFLPKITPNLT